jgi:hypothetical protein
MDYSVFSTPLVIRKKFTFWLSLDIIFFSHVLTTYLQTISIFNLPLENKNHFSPFYDIINCKRNYIKVTNIFDIYPKKPLFLTNLLYNYFY